MEDSLEVGKSISTVSSREQNLKKTEPIRGDSHYIDRNTDRRSVQEINYAMSKMKNGKAPAGDRDISDLHHPFQFFLQNLGIRVHA